MKKNLIVLTGLSILIATFGITSVQAEVLSDCQRIEKQVMVGTERILETTYNCKMQTNGTIGVTQEGLTLEEKQVLETIRFERLNGTYVQPPIQEPEKTLTDLEKRFCEIRHFSNLVKEQYGCFD